MEEKIVPPQRKRASAPRVRTGCKTCKVRMSLVLLPAILAIDSRDLF
jgi:hypothetical protein